MGEIPAPTISALVNKLSESQHLWFSDQTQFSTELPNAQHIVLKFPDNYPHSHTPASYRPEWSHWKHLLSPIISNVAAKFQFDAFETSKIMFTRLNPWGKVPTHADLNPSSVLPHKIHVPLMTHPNVLFRIEDVPYHLAAGRAYELNNLLPHSVENDSDTPRIHFIFDCFSLKGTSRSVE